MTQATKIVQFQEIISAEEYFLHPMVTQKKHANINIGFFRMEIADTCKVLKC